MAIIRLDTCTMICHRGTEVPSDRHTSEILGAAIEVHRRLGPGLLESAYEACLCKEMSFREIPFEQQVEVPLYYRGMTVDCGYRLDIVAFESVIVEVKSVSKVLPIHQAQVLTYLRTTGFRLGLLINFNVEVLRLGIRRLVNG